mgnify:CR=1 FL=1
MRKFCALLAVWAALMMAACGDTIYNNRYTLTETEARTAAFEAVAPNVAELKYGDEFGTGFVYTVRDGAPVLVTALHVVGTGFDPALLSVRFYGETDYAVSTEDAPVAELLGYDETYDVAVLRLLSAPDRDFADLGADRVSGPEPGSATLCIGNAGGGGLYASDGIVSAAERVMSVDGRYLAATATTSAVNAGCSGGPVVDLSGRLVGMGFAQQLTLDGSDRPVQDMNFMIPAEIVDAVCSLVLDRAEAGNTGALPYLSGLLTLSWNPTSVKATAQSVSLGITGTFTADGFTVTDAFTGTASSAFRTGDVIRTIGGADIDGYIGLTAALYRATGRTADTAVTVLRGGAETEISINLR